MEPMSVERATTRKARHKQAEPEKPTATSRVEVEDIDSLLADIDEILETNELEVVRRFRQKGGE
jgi:ubiquitin-like protein Pup